MRGSWYHLGTSFLVQKSKVIWWLYQSHSLESRVISSRYSICTNWTTLDKNIWMKLGLNHKFNNTGSSSVLLVTVRVLLPARNFIFPREAMWSDAVIRTGNLESIFFPWISLSSIFHLWRFYSTEFLSGIIHIIIINSLFQNQYYLTLSLRSPYNLTK